MTMTILKPHAAPPGRARGYTITVVRDGVRSSYAVIAMTGRDAIDRMRAISEPRRADDSGVAA